MIQKRIFKPEEINNLIPQWDKLDEYKLAKLRDYTLRNSPFDKTQEVLQVNPILVMSMKKGYFILNGKHRSILSLHSNHKLEGIILNSANDLCHHTPKICFEDLDPQRITSLYGQENLYHNNKYPPKTLKALYILENYTHFIKYNSKGKIINLKSLYKKENKKINKYFK